jgi:SAM-dependent methyltransferase
MQERHRDNERYFDELSTSCREYYIPYIEKYFSPNNISVLEIGCGQGGNLYPFYERNCNVVGLDLSGDKILAARYIFSQKQIQGVTFEFRAENIYDTIDDRKYDLILVHDVIEHVREKQILLDKAKQMLTKNGIIFFKFPAWNMPFGGHQQICSNRVCAVIPFTHLLPSGIYKSYLKLFRENKGTIDELLDIKACKTTIEMFEGIVATSGLKTLDRTLWLINPHYKVKFGLTPRKLNKFFSGVKYVRNYLATSCFYLLQKNAENVN